MKLLKGRFTVHEVEDSHIAEVLARETSPRRRSRLLVQYANLGRMLEKMGVNGGNGSGIGSQPAIDTSDTPLPPQPTVITDLGDIFFANALSDFMPSRVEGD